MIKVFKNISHILKSITKYQLVKQCFCDSYIQFDFNKMNIDF